MKVDKFIWQAGDTDISLCAYCRHLKGGAVCAAYPAGIPEKILNNEHDHRKPYPGDNGIQFEALDDNQD